MNGTSVTPVPLQGDGLMPEKLSNDDSDSTKSLASIIEALEAIHSPQSSNEARVKASVFLDQARAQDQAPFVGYTLASDLSQPPPVRHYALSMIEYAIQHRWIHYSGEQAVAVREWTLSLGSKVKEQDPLYVRTKQAQLWVDIAKRSWALDWMGLDEALLQLWAGPQVQREFVLYVLENLSEDIFCSEDSIAALRGAELSKACVEIFTPAAIFAEQYPTRETSANVRQGDEGWLARLAEFLGLCLENNVEIAGPYQTGAIRALAVMKSVAGWAIPKAIVAAHLLELCCRAMATSSVPVQFAAVEALHSLFSRAYLQDDDFFATVCPMYRTEVVNLMKSLYERSIVDVTDIDESKYILLQKLVELLANLGHYIIERPQLVPEGSDLAGFFFLMLTVVRNQSLLVTIPVLHTFVRLLRIESIGDSETILPLIGPLLQICSERLFRYEALPEDSDDPTFIFLNEDIETVPERHVFLGNYRRYCVEVVEIVTRRKPFDALGHIITQVDEMLQRLYSNQPPFKVEFYTRNSIPTLIADAHFTVVEAALRGYAKWSTSQSPSPPADVQQTHDLMDNSLENWCERILQINHQDPLIQKCVTHLSVDIAASTRKPAFTLAVLERILSLKFVEDPDYPAYSEAVQELRKVCSHELHRLALHFSDYFYSTYEDIERRINVVISGPDVDDRLRLQYQTFLFTITHRSACGDDEVRRQRLASFLEPVKGLWLQPQMLEALSSFENFCRFLGLDKVQQYLLSKQAHQVENWSTFALDDEGMAIKSQTTQSFEALPIRATKSFLGVSVDKMKRTENSYRVTCSLWKDVIPQILPHLLKLISFSHALHVPENWTGLPGEMHSVVKHVLTDRFWQAGISSGSRDDFYAKVTGTKTSLEGFASSVRGTIRAVREQCYAVLGFMTRLEDHFYGFSELPEPLSEALFTDARSLSTHQLSVLLNVSRTVIDNCPVHQRSTFLSPFLYSLFIQLDQKIHFEWQRLIQRRQTSSYEDDLTNEMRDESILRQLTFAAVTTVAGILHPQRPNPPFQTTSGPLPSQSEDQSKSSPAKSNDTYPSMRMFIISNPRILEAIILFMTHAIYMQDSRCCNITINVFRSIIPEFRISGGLPAAPMIRDYISSEVLKASIASLHEPYFVDLQKELAQLIATIIHFYGTQTEVVAQVLLSINGMTEPIVGRAMGRIVRNQSARQQRALVLELLESLRGVRVSEQGKFAKPDPKKVKSAIQEKYMTIDTEPTQSQREQSPDLGGIADMFG
ncbi:hypothetical protein L228DRAFT_248578 [Xylona heveae TC161]|uniref:ARM repeat-containing protein n=1 Tax=Xylona heveae (strain CBS 132557 / TC161) TaxID=1328760 RepID=A0A165G7G4_XYLHT|nr:hypothetical protein L228DRAFT_248578 [Xylona heveae TC161]KZF21826.1 hypothetical protein L228DRAFT_248578 [Xylona heveae TC161]